MNPLVSIVTANYNKAGFISETILSVIAQTYKDWELLIIDDRSTDESIQVIAPFLSDNRISLIENQENRGGNFCRNLGIKKAKGEYLIFLDADDLLSPVCLENRIKSALEFPNVNLLVFSMGVFRHKRGDVSGDWVPNSSRPLEDFLQHKLPWSILQPLWKRELLLQLEGFDEAFQRLQDVELNTRALLIQNISYKQFPGAPDCFYRIDDTRKNFKASVFMLRWITSAVLYVEKFAPLVKAELRPYLSGTVYETYLNLLYYYKTGQVTNAEFMSLEQQLLKPAIKTAMSPFKRTLFTVARSYNLKSFRIPGINKIIKKLITL